MATKFDQRDMDAMALALKTLGATRPCARCGWEKHKVYEWAIELPINLASEPEPKIVPCAAVICQKCGHVSLHEAVPLFYVAADEFPHVEQPPGSDPSPSESPDPPAEL